MKRHTNDTDDSDSLAFLLMMFLATKLKRQGPMIRTIMDTIAADAMRYFLVIFSAHFVLVMTLNLGPVRPLLISGVRPLASNPLFARNQFNSFQARKSFADYPASCYSHAFSSR